MDVQKGFVALDLSENIFMFFSHFKLNIKENLLSATFSVLELAVIIQMALEARLFKQYHQVPGMCILLRC